MVKHLSSRIRRNPAIASRSGVPTHLTSDHASRDDVHEATSLLQYILAHPHPIGYGNFGVAHLAPGPTIVKLPARTNLYGVPWTPAAQRANLLHEAGVANELESLGYDVVPHSVFVESDDGTPAIVREYGDSLSSMKPAEFELLETTLADIEARAGWSVFDQISLYRRRNRTIFVGDVGVWQPPGHGGKLPSHLGVLLAEVADKFLGSPVWPMCEMVTAMERLRNGEETLIAAVNRGDDGRYVFHEAHDVTLRVRKIAKEMRRRLNVRLRVPVGVMDAIDGAWETLRVAGERDQHAAIGMWEAIREEDRRSGV